jgi:hypothetical protein
MHELREIVADVSARFGKVAIVATHQLKTTKEAALAKSTMTAAVDFRPERRTNEIKVYLRGRKEIGGLESYRDGVIPVDVAGTALASRTPLPPNVPLTLSGLLAGLEG